MGSAHCHREPRRGLVGPVAEHRPPAGTGPRKKAQSPQAHLASGSNSGHTLLSSICGASRGVLGTQEGTKQARESPVSLVGPKLLGHPAVGVVLCSPSCFARDQGKHPLPQEAAGGAQYNGDTLPQISSLGFSRPNAFFRLGMGNGKFWVNHSSFSVSTPAQVAPDSLSLQDGIWSWHPPLCTCHWEIC